MVLTQKAQCLDFEKEYGGKEDEVLWPHRLNKQPRKRWKVSGEGVRPASRLDKAGYGRYIPTSDRYGDKERRREIVSHNSTDSRKYKERV